ncbi:MAG: peroxiredoxin [Rhodospirillales bacterium]|nr:peroxiredoxin [Rhodospirillales bacterium]
MTIKVGDTMPQGTMHIMTADGPSEVSTSELFDGKKVVLFSVPGAFTPTCSARHLPSFVLHHDALKAKGVDTIACMAVNDAFVMGAWGDDQNVGDKVMMLADGAADYSRALGLELDLSGVAFGMRGKRFSILVDNGVVQQLNVDEEGYGSTSAETMLEQLG